MPKMKTPVLLCLLIAVSLPAFAAEPTVQEIIDRSLKASEADWKAFPGYSHMERNKIVKDDSKKDETYEVLMIDGSSYKRLIAVDGKRLPPAAQEREVEKLRQVIERRANESAGERRDRIEEYQKKRRRMLDMMREMTKGLNFKLVGGDRVAGYDTYVLDATPRPGYRPPNREAKVLTGMRGRLWIDKQDYHWVKADAEVIKPVRFVWFLAKVLPGTHLVFEQAPVADGVWEPRQFRLDVKASFLWMNKSFFEDDTYWDYRRLIRDPSSGSLRDPARIPLALPEAHSKTSQPSQ